MDQKSESIKANSKYFKWGQFKPQKIPQPEKIMNRNQTKFQTTRTKKGEIFAKHACGC